MLHEAASALGDLLRPPARLEWNRDHAAIVIQASSPWPTDAPAVALNTLPDALVWGDGRIVWVEHLSGGARGVNAGTLHPREMAQLLQRFDRSRFFRLARWYPGSARAADSCRSLSVHLLHASHEVSAADGAAPRAFTDLYALVSSGAGAVGLPYHPTEGLLVASSARRSTRGPLPAWDVSATGLRLDNAVQGAWVDGPALEHAWKLVNARPRDPRVAQGSRAYLLTLQVPDIITWEPRLP